MYHSKVTIILRKSILDPQGKAVELGIHSLGYTGVANVRIGKCVEMDIDTNQCNDAEKISREISDKLLANPIMEDFSISLEEYEG
ncbi:MAG: phosphoribosylformylglycinamidine synthase subunit PurS [Bacteroidota bacterium]